MPATTAEIRKCRTCDEDMAYVPFGTRKYGQPGYLTGWVHAATGQERGDGSDGGVLNWHLAGPKPRCPKCQSERYVTTDEAWGWALDCRDCGHHDFRSIGD